MKVSWRKYIDKTSANPPRPFLVEAVGYAPSKQNALDLGAGALNDSRYLLAQGFSVIAIDDDEAAQEQAGLIKDDLFTFLRTDVNKYKFPEATFDLINGQYFFSFLNKETFPETMKKIFRALKPEGVITGQIFGDRDEWEDRVLLSKDQFLKLFSNFTILKLEEEEKDKETALGKMKHWHTFHFIARKIP